MCPSILALKTHTEYLFTIKQTYVAAESTCISKSGREEAVNRVCTKVVNKHRRALDQREHRVLLQLHVVGDLQIGTSFKIPYYARKLHCHGK